MDQAFKHDLAAAGIDVRTGEDGTWITLTTKDGSGFMFQPATQFKPQSSHDLNARIVNKWCAERAAEAEGALAPSHVCGLSGYNGMIDPPCPACEKNF